MPCELPTSLLQSMVFILGFSSVSTEYRQSWEVTQQTANPILKWLWAAFPRYVAD